MSSCASGTRRTSVSASHWRIAARQWKRLYFKDAFRLSIFDCESQQATETCMRWKAEQKLKELLGLSVNSYVSWELE